MADYRNSRNGMGRTEEMLDSENQQRVEGLSSKVSRLKNIALDLESDTKDSNRYIDDMGVGDVYSMTSYFSFVKQTEAMRNCKSMGYFLVTDLQANVVLVLYLDQGIDYDSTQGLLGGSVNRLTHMVQANKGNRRLMCYLILGLVVLFFLSYYLISRVSR